MPATHLLTGSLQHSAIPVHRLHHPRLGHASGSNLVCQLLFTTLLRQPRFLFCDLDFELVRKVVICLAVAQLRHGNRVRGQGRGPANVSKLADTVAPPMHQPNLSLALHPHRPQSRFTPPCHPCSSPTPAMRPPARSPSHQRCSTLGSRSTPHRGGAPGLHGPHGRRCRRTGSAR